MKYSGLVVLLTLAVGACRLGETTPGGAPERSRLVRREPIVRIGLKVDTTAIKVRSASALEIADRAGNIVARGGPSEQWTFTSDAPSRINGAGSAGGSFTSEVVPLTVRAGGGFINVGDRDYRGDLILRTAGAGRLTAVNTLELEQYLLGVVPFEIGRLKSSEIEAVKAQAVAARTYAIGNQGSREALGFDFFATVADQVYGGTSGEDSVASRAVRETRGEIITHAGQPIIAYYSSTCGGHTADANESWPWRAPQPYLRGRQDTDANGEAYCKTSNRFRWSVSWSGDSLRTVLQQTLGQRFRNPAFRIARVDDVRVTGTSRSGRAEAVEITADGTVHRVPADSIRWVLRPTVAGSLNSSFIQDMKATQKNGEVTRLEVHGGGWGHGVGMCQVGAIGRARAGQSYRQIVDAYYSDTELLRLY
jgi:stage II sporulation protein D